MIKKIIKSILYERNKRYETGAEKAIGQRTIQSIEYGERYNSAGDLFVALSDGTIDHPNGRKTAEFSVEYALRAFWELGDALKGMKPEEIENFLLNTAMQLNLHIEDHFYMDTTPVVSLTMALFIKNHIYCFNVGANKVFIYDGYREFELNHAKFAGGDESRRYYYGECELEYGKHIIGFFSNGVYCQFHSMNRIKIIAGKGTLLDKAKKIVEKVKAENFDNQSNIIVVLFGVVKNEKSKQQIRS
jgi:serine/threonine protein phosphatase PrpC